MLAISTASLYIEYPTRVKSSVEGFQDRSIWEDDTAVAVKPVGTVGGVVSVPYVVNDVVKVLCAANVLSGASWATHKAMRITLVIDLMNAFLIIERCGVILRAEEQ
jgi:hypothetical protein